MTTRIASINVEILSDTHRISCRVEVGATGLVGLFNDVNTSLVEASMVYISRIQEPAKIIANFETATLNKNNLAMVIVTKRESLGPPGYASGGFTRLMPYAVMITTTAFEVQGNVEVPGKLDAGALLMGGGSGRFMSLYQAKITTTRYPETPAYEAEAMLLNRNLASAFAAVPKGKT
jgi:hypothetical protein